MYGISKNHSQTHTFQLTGTVHTLYSLLKITVKHKHLSLLVQSVLCMGCQKITVKHTHFSLPGQSIRGLKKSWAL